MLPLLLILFHSIHLLVALPDEKWIYTPKDFDHNAQWKSFHRSVQFLPGDLAETMSDSFVSKLSRQLEQEDDEQEEEEEGDDQPADNNFEQENDDVYRVQPFVEGISEYDEYQQAWRLLGFMIDCDDTRMNMYDDDYYYHQQGGSWDGGTGEGCHRYVLWAAYVDLGYQGGGIGEYQFWDRDSQKWDDTPCYHSLQGDGTKSRCAKMDCHLENTHWSLLGFFKHQSYDDWMEQLFKHEGICVWNNQEYSFMKDARETWPQGCSDSGSYDERGNSIYYDLKPTVGGRMTVGLYTDTRCVEEYQSTGSDDPITVENLLGNFLVEGEGSHDSGDDGYKFDFSGYSFQESLNFWHSSMDAFKVCQPCIAHDLQNYNGNNNNNNDDGGNWWNRYRNNNDDAAAQNYQGGDNFDCYDDADYTNVNQCMKFMAKTTMNTATFRDLSLARMQGTLADSPLAGFMTQNGRKGYYRRASFGTFLTYLFLLVSMGMAVYGLTYFLRVKRETNYSPSWNPKEPLVFA